MATNNRPGIPVIHIPRGLLSNGMARAPLPPDEVKRNLLAVRLTDAERKALTEQAEAAGVTLTEFVRRHLPIEEVA